MTTPVELTPYAKWVAEVTLARCDMLVSAMSAHCRQEIRFPTEWLEEFRGHWDRLRQLNHFQNKDCKNAVYQLEVEMAVMTKLVAAKQIVPFESTNAVRTYWHAIKQLDS